MRISAIRLSVCAVLLSVLAMVGSASASAEGISCTENTGKIKLSPGLTNTPKVQTISIKGTLTGCSSAESAITEGKYNVKMKTATPVDCSVLTGAVAVEEETKIIIKWSPKAKGQRNSIGTFTMPISESSVGVSLGGSLESGPFSGTSISGTVTQTYTNGPTCGEATGKKKKKTKPASSGEMKANGSLGTY